MRPLLQDMPLVDGEGFPQEMIRGGEGRDGESGELVTMKIHYLRKHPDLRTSPRIDSLLFSDALGDRRTGGFRIQNFTRGRASEGVRRGSRQGNGHGNPQHVQTCVYMKGGEAVHFAVRPLDARNSLDVARSEECVVRPYFRVPRDSLLKTSTDESVRKPNTICVNIWEEFLYGKGVITPSSGQNQEPEEEKKNEEIEEGPVSYVRRILSRLLPKFVVDLIIYTTYFLLFFSSLVGYNMYCELGCYILLAQHLQIHEKAYERKVDVMFTGSLFQGPLYALTRNWCEHCNQWDRAQVMRNLMKKMKADILSNNNDTNTTPQDDTKDPP